MTKQEARNHFKLKDTDVVYKDGILSVKRSAEHLLKVWSIASDTRKRCLLDIEACEALLKDL